MFRAVSCWSASSQTPQTPPSSYPTLSVTRQVGVVQLVVHVEAHVTELWVSVCPPTLPWQWHELFSFHCTNDRIGCLVLAAGYWPKCQSQLLTMLLVTKLYDNGEAIPWWGNSLRSQDEWQKLIHNYDFSCLWWCIGKHCTLMYW